ncbi:hypothetical protein Xbed_00735 [Xenorhabdus beddingii]|uniref:Uncharacterized protein n=1 Tax=Xenorhabdus beddingii TaxID=40578 RepID=A0A1Y2SS10_9GAMM|nr:hypothetical protein Xbed_00735 [Xenorhabdus beddingii]
MSMFFVGGRLVVNLGTVTVIVFIIMTISHVMDDPLIVVLIAIISVMSSSEHQEKYRQVKNKKCEIQGFKSGRDSVKNDFKWADTHGSLYRSQVALIALIQHSASVALSSDVRITYCFFY